MSQSPNPPTPPASWLSPPRSGPWRRIVRITRPIFSSEVKWSAIGWLTLLLLLLLSVTRLNVLNNYVGGGFMTAISERNPSRYREMAIRYLVVFALSTVVAVFAKFSEERLGILWRQWLTGHLLDKYLANRNYHRLLNRADIDNPDQRITEDVKNFTTTTLSFLLMLLNATITAVAFSQVCWGISPLLLGVAVGYATAGSLLIMLVGRKLIGLNNLQLKREADFRYELIHVREYADSIALLQGEKKHRSRLGMRLGELAGNFRKIISVNRNLGFFTIGYNYLIQIIPVLIVAPRYIRGETEFGSISQSMQAFAQIIGAFSLIVTQFAQISSFAAVVNRMGAIWEVLDETPEPIAARIEVVFDDNRLAYEHLTLRMPKDGKVLIQNLNVEIRAGRRLLILGPDGIGKSALGRATAAIWTTGEGRIVRPSQKNLLFVPQRPYTALGTLRDQFFEAETLGPDADERLIAALTQVALGPILDRVGGLDVERDWGNLLTVGEQQLLGIARLLISQPRFAYLDRATNALSASRVKHVYELLAATPISYISVGDQPNLRDYHDMVLEIQDGGLWTAEATHQPLPV